MNPNTAPTQQPQTPPENVPTGNVQVAPAAPATAGPGAGTIVLGWLTYAFWGWTVLALSFLTSMLISYYFNHTDSGDLSAYIIAAVLVLLPISLVCDFFYTKQEPAKKTGAMLAVMVIHAVIFAIFAIGSLITAVWSVVSMFLSASRSENSNTMTVLASAIIIMIFYLLTFVRTLNPAKFGFVPKVYKITMGVLVGLICLLTVAGPVMGQRSTRGDKLIEGGLSSIESDINSYVDTNNKLPASLSDLTVSGDAKQLVEQNLVEYKPESTTQSSTSFDSSSSSKASTYMYYYYQLCVTYKAKSGTGQGTTSSSRYDSSNIRSGYSSSLSTYNHPAGNVCYKLYASSYNKKALYY